jgi:glucose uptake protein GlcU
MVPAQYSMDQKLGSPNGIDYVFSHFIGIYLSSTFYFILYCAWQNNLPVLNPRIALPGFCSGLLWAIAQTAFFVANDQLKFVVTFPVLGVVPGILATIIGILFYNEISGTRNFQIIGISIATTTLGCLFIALSTILG